MPWPRPAQRVLIVLAGGLLALGAAAWREASRQPLAHSAPDEPALELRLDLNGATAAELESLPGVGASLAGRVDAYRRAHGPFRTVDELRRVPGFGGKLVEALRPLVAVR